METMDGVKILVKALDDKKARNIQVMNVTEVTSLAEYFIICSCTSSVQVKACADEAEEKAKEAGFPLHHKEGYAGGAWILLDFGHIIVHAMQEETRDFYNIERLWDEGVIVPVETE